MIQHSHPSEITLKQIRIEKDKSPEAKKLLFDNLSRLRELGLTFQQCGEEEIVGVIGRIFRPGDAPHLVSLELENHAYTADRVDVPEPPSSLTSLSLKDLRLSFPKTSILSHITDFSISFSLFETTAHVDWFCDILDRMPNLLHLHISDHSYSGNRKPLNPSRTQPITLPNLRRLRFFGPSQTYVYVLRRLRLSIPATTYHQLTFTESLSSSYHEKGAATASLDEVISSTLKDRARDDTSSSAYHVKFSMTTKEDHGSGIDPSDPEAFSIRIMILAAPCSGTDTADCSYTKPESTIITEPVPVLTVEYQSSSWEWMSGPAYFPRDLLKFTNLLPTDSIEEVHIRTNMPLKEYNYDSDRESAKSRSTSKVTVPVQGFLTCPNVKTLHLEGLRAIDWMCDYLTLTRTPTTTTPTQTFSVFPNLANLTLHSIDWTKEREVHDIFNASEDIPPVMNSVASVLEKRATKLDGRSKIRRLEVIGGVPAAWIRKVEKGKWIDAGAGGDCGVVWDKNAYCDWDDEWDGEEDDQW